MLSVTIKSLNNLIMNFFLTLAIRNATESNVKIFSKYTIFWLLVSILPCIIFYKIGYNLAFTLLSLIFLTISLNKIFNYEISEGIILSFTFMVLSIIPDLIISSILISFFNYNELKSNFLLMMITNFLVSVLTYILFNISFIKNTMFNILNHTKNSKYKHVIIYIIMSFFAICIIFSLARDFYKPTSLYFGMNIVIITFVVLIFIYIFELVNFNKLEDKNTVLYDCMKNIENYQEQQDLKIHEYKNQLSKIIGITSDKRIINKIEEILDVDLNANMYLLGKLKRIPTGEMKSLIYYKMLITLKYDINLVIDVSEEIKDEDFNFTNNQSKALSNLIGIFFDNALEAAKDTKGKIVSLEIYKSGLGVCFSISNTFNPDNFDIDKIEDNGYTTKGTGHGKGLHLAKMIVNKYNGVYTRKSVENNVFYQRIIVRK